SGLQLCVPLAPGQHSSIGLNVLRHQFERTDDVGHGGAAISQSAERLGTQHEVIRAREWRNATAPVDISKCVLDAALAQCLQACELKLLGVRVAALGDLPHRATIPDVSRKSRCQISPRRQSYPARCNEVLDHPSSYSVSPARGAERAERRVVWDP